MNHIHDAKKMVGDTPRTDAEANDQYSMVLTGNGLRRALVQSDFARQLERELVRCNNLYRKLDVHSLNLSDLIRKLERELQQWKEYAGRLEEAGDKLCGAFGREWLTDGDIEAIQDDWEKAKEANP